MFLLALIACTPELVVSGDDTESTAETGDTGEPPEPEPDLSQYSAELTWTWDTWGDGCEDTTLETGAPIDDADVLAAVQEQCAACDVFYVATQDKEKLCDSDWYQVPETDYRGIAFSPEKGLATVYRFEQSSWTGEWSKTILDDAATFDGWSVTISTKPVDTWGADLTVAGTLAFPELDVSGE